jgi:hypothetical protein
LELQFSLLPVSRDFAVLRFGYDFLAVFAKNAVTFLPTLLFWQRGHLITGFSSYSLIER